MVAKKSKKKQSVKKNSKKTTKKTAKKAAKNKKSVAKKKVITKVAKKKKAVKKKTSASKKTVKKKQTVKKRTSKKAPIKKKIKQSKAKKSTKKTNKPLKQSVATKKKPALLKASKKNIKKKIKPRKKTIPTKVLSPASPPKKANKPMLENINPPQVQLDTSPDEFIDPIDLKTTAGVIDFTPYNANTAEEYMCDRQKNHFYNILTTWKSQLMSEVDSTVGHMKQEGLSFADPLDRAAQEEGFNLELRTRDRERKLIKKIEQSIDDIDKGLYGYCEECGVEIGIRRLEARPTADKCIDCKTFSEIRERKDGF